MRNDRNEYFNGSWPIELIISEMKDVIDKMMHTDFTKEKNKHDNNVREYWEMVKLPYLWMHGVERGEINMKRHGESIQWNWNRKHFQSREKSIHTNSRGT